MFKKDFTVKSNTNVRSSDRRKLLARFQANEIPSKAAFSLSQAKIASANGTQLNVYSCEKDPYFFELQHDTNLFPTVYFTWICPTCVPVLLVLPKVLKFIENGADLMLPGVELPGHSMPEFDKDVPVAIAVYYEETNTFSPIAIGTSLMSSADMIASGMKGKGVKILHIYQDKLWEFGSKSKLVQIPLSKIYDLSDLPEIEKLDIADNEEKNEAVEAEVEKETVEAEAEKETGHHSVSESIQMSVEKRSGKKVVTLVNNTSCFGIDAKAFSKKLKVALGTSVAVKKDIPNCKGPQLLLQGNHMAYLEELLQNEYGIQKESIKGLELGIKKNK